MPIDEALFRKAMSHFASGVTIVTTVLEGQRYGMTVASFCSLSLRPPMVLVCIEKNVKTHDAIDTAGSFGVSMLAHDHAEVSNRFASRLEDKFEGMDVTDGKYGMPLIAGAVTSLECRVVSRLPGGDHTIFVGEVLEATTTEEQPLVYFRSGYHALQS